MFFVISLGVFILDQVTKMLIMATMFLGQSIPVIENIFHITYIHNPGAAFGLLAHRTSFFIAVSLLSVAGAVIYHWKSGVRRGMLPGSLGLITGGALGNLVDRIRFGEVVDFFDFRIWPIFNVADTAIVLGAVLLALILLRPEVKP